MKKQVALAWILLLILMSTSVYSSGKVNTTTLYHQDDIGAVYIHLDGELRHVPNPKTYNNLFNLPLVASQFIRFKNASKAPYPISKRPLMNNAKLVRVKGTAPVYLTETYPWDKGTVYYRHVINPEQFNTLNFDWNKVQEISEKPKNISVPLAINTNKNYNSILQLKKYYALYNYLIIKGKMNPYFKDALKNYSGRPSTKYKQGLKQQIIHWQDIVNKLPNS